MSTPRARCDDGSGLLSAFAGISVFLLFLLFAVQLLVGLYTRSVVTDVTRAGAAAVAGARVDHEDPAAVAEAEQAAEDHMRDQLGRAGDAARFDWSGTDGEQVVLRVRVRAPRFLFGRFAATPLATDEVDRTVRVRVEALR